MSNPFKPQILGITPGLRAAPVDPYLSSSGLEDPSFEVDSQPVSNSDVFGVPFNTDGFQYAGPLTQEDEAAIEQTQTQLDQQEAARTSSDDVTTEESPADVDEPALPPMPSVDVPGLPAEPESEQTSGQALKVVGKVVLWGAVGLTVLSLFKKKRR